MTCNDDQANVVAFALWGAGSHARTNILPALNICTKTDIAGILTRNKKILRSESKKWACNSWSEASDMLSAEGIDAIYISTPTGLHFSHVKQCLEAGYSVLCEKPLTLSLSQTSELVECAHKNNQIISVACTPIYHRQFKKIMSLTRGIDNKIGRIEHITAKFTFPHLELENFRYNSVLGGGAFLDIAFYLLYITELLIANPIKSIESEIVREPGFEVDTCGKANLRFEHGETADLEWGYGREYVNDLKIDGEIGSIYARPVFSKPVTIPAIIELSTKHGMQRFDIGQDNSFVNMLEEFAKAKSDGVLRDKLFERVIRTQTLLEQAYQEGQ